MRLAAFLVAFTTVSCSGAVDVSQSRQDGATSTGMDSAMHGHDGGANVADGGVSDGALPICHWPSNILPRVPDGGISGGSIARTVLFCGGVSFDGGASGSEFCPSESSSTCTRTDGGGYVVGPPDEPCVMACLPTQYAVLTSDPFDYGPNGPSPDADVIYPHAPSGCTGVQPAFTTAMSHTAYAEQPPSVLCCPCE